jgi:hypothetical protein
MVANSAGTQPTLGGSANFATNVAAGLTLGAGTVAGVQTVPLAVGSTVGAISGVAAFNVFALVS